LDTAFLEVFSLPPGREDSYRSCPSAQGAEGVNWVIPHHNHVSRLNRELKENLFQVSLIRFRCRDVVPSSHRVEEPIKVKPFENIFHYGPLVKGEKAELEA